MLGRVVPALGEVVGLVIEPYRQAAPGGARFFIDDGGGGHVLQRRAGAVEHEDFLRGGPSGPAPRDQLAEFRMDPPEVHHSRRERVLQLAHAGGLSGEVRDDTGPRQHSRVQLLLALAVGADRRDELAGPDVGLADDDLPARGAGDGDVRMRQRLGGGFHWLDVDAGLGREFPDECHDPCRVAIAGIDMLEPADGEQGPQVRAALDAAAADEERLRVRQCQVARGDRGGRRRAQRRDFDRVQQGERPSVRGVEQADHALDGRQPIEVRVAGKVRVDLRGVIAGGGAEHRGLDVEATARDMRGERAGRGRKRALGVGAEGALDRRDAVRHRQQCRDVLAIEEQHGALRP